MFKNLGKLRYSTKIKELKLSLKNLKPGSNFFETFIIYKKDNEIKIYDRKCDHAGGKIISRGSKAICPIHMWEFDPSTGSYENGIKKKEIKYTLDKNFIKIYDVSYIPEIEKVKNNLNT